MSNDSNVLKWDSA